MIDKNLNSESVENEKQRATGRLAEIKIDQAKSTMSKSMHDGVAVWCDCCSCEAEPYWVEAMEDYQNAGNKGKT